MSSLATYEQVLNALNRDVARSKPDDPLQFCANWFQLRLEEQRANARSQSHHASQLPQSPIRGSSPGYGAGSSGTPGLRKRPSASLIGQGYSFGSSGSGGSSFHNSDANGAPSPFSETPPAIGTLPPQPSGPGAAATYVNRGRGSVSGPSSLSRSTVAPMDDDDDRSDDENAERSRGRESSERPPATTALGIPLAYNLGRRASVSAESTDVAAATQTAKIVIHKTPSQRARIEAAIKGNLLFRNLDEEQHNDVLNAMKEVRVTKDHAIIKQNDVGDYCYIVEEGSFSVHIKQPDTRPGEPGLKVNSIHAGGFFGELALLYNAPRAATVICSSDRAVLWALARVTFRSILIEHTSRKRKQYESFLASVDILHTLEPHERAKIADSLEERIYEDGEDACVQGEVGTNFYLIETGQAEVLKDGHSVAVLGRGQYFGELALIENKPRAATVRALGRLKVATLGEKAFSRLLGPVSELLKRRADANYGPSSYTGRQQSEQSQMRSSLPTSPPPTSLRTTRSPPPRASMPSIATGSRG